MNRLTVLALLSLAVVSGSLKAQATEVPRYKYLRYVSENDPFAFKMKKHIWSAEDESEFAAFVAKIGTAVEAGKCKGGFVSCMTNPQINPFYSSDPNGLKYFADCSDVPYYLRTYFAWKKGLPISIASATAPRDPNDPKAQNRNSTVSGNLITQRADTLSTSSGKFPSVLNFLGSTSDHGLIIDTVSTGMYRTPVIPNAGEAPSDFYPIAINKKSLKVGTVIYTAGGHVAIVYRIEKDGNLKTLNGSPANADIKPSPIQVRDFNSDFERSRQEHGSVFKNFRPIEVVGFQRSAAGNLIGGKIIIKADSEISDYSSEQATKKFSNYYLYVREQMADGALKIEVVNEFKRELSNLCRKVQERANMVRDAQDENVDGQPLLVTPANIFSDHGAWENYSTPGRDVDIRKLFKSIRDGLIDSVKSVRSGSAVYSYAGKNLPQDLMNAYRDVAGGCKITYTSRGSGVTKELDLEQVRTRMFKISFDPHHCADLRWGDFATGQKVCGEDMRWYNAQQYLRNYVARNATSQSLTVEQLEAENKRLNKPFEWNTNIMGYIQDLATAVGQPLK